MNIQEILKAIIPILVVSIGWLLGQVNGFNERLIKVEGEMKQLFMPDGKIRSSDESREARVKDEEESNAKFADLNVRVKLLEERYAKK
jgi:hypothetical protein